jgi:hypothetical protein
MANVDRPNGFVPVRHKNGTPYANQTNLYLVPVGDGTALFVGDLVKAGGTAGTAGLRVDGVDVEGMPTVTQAAAGDVNIVGVVVGFYPRPNALETKHRPASTAMIAMVADDPDLIFEVQEDSVGAALAAVDVGENADVIVGSGSATTGLSAMEIDSSTHTAATAQLRIYRLVPRPNNVIGDNARWEVLINEHAFKTTAGT